MTSKRNVTTKQRVEESRRLEERLNELRPVMHMMHQDALHIPQESIPYGWEYFWVRESTLGDPDLGRTTEMKKKGWTPVPAHRHPEMSYDDFLSRQLHLKGFIFHKGLVLFERPKEIGDREREALEKYNEKIMGSMQGTEHFMNEQHIPARFIGNNNPIRSNDF
jgi:hypothetical protein